MLIDEIGDLKPVNDVLDVVSTSENGFGSLIEIDDAELSETENGTPAVDDEYGDDDSDEEWEFSPKSNPDEDEEYLNSMIIDTEDEIELKGFSRDWHEKMRMSFVRSMLSTIDETYEEDYSEEKVEWWWSGYCWAEECEWLDWFDWAEECDSDNE